MRLVFIGTEEKINLVQRVVSVHFSELQTYYILDESVIYSEETAQKIKNIPGHIDGVIFGDEIQHDLYLDFFHGICPCRYFSSDHSSLMKAFIKLFARGIGLTAISIDNYPYTTIKSMAAEFKLTTDALHLVNYHGSNRHSMEYYEQLLDKHLKLYQSGKTRGAITTIRYIARKLEEEQIPVVYLEPAYESVIQTLRDFLHTISDLYKDMESSLSILQLKLLPREEVALSHDGGYLDVREKLGAAAEIHYFARNNHATVITQSDDLFTIIMKSADLIRYSQELTIFPLLQLIWDNTRCNFSMGIGMGIDPWDAKLNASMALKKASQIENAGVYISYNPVNIIGPMMYVDEHVNRAQKLSQKSRDISNKTGISEERLNMLMEYLQELGQDSVTAHDLCTNLKLSARASNRMLSTLEEYGYAAVIGHLNKGKAGRPLNVYHIKLS